MTAAMSELDQHTLLPPKPDSQDREQLRALVTALPPREPSTRPARLVSPGGEEIELPDGLYDVLRGAVQVLLDGKGVTIAPQSAMLSTQAAADLLGISRPTLVKLLEEGKIPYEQAGNRRHRRIQLADLEKYRQESRASRRAALREMTQEDEQDGLYETGTGFIATR